MLKEHKTHLLARWENTFLRKRYLNRNLKTAAGLAREREEGLPNWGARTCARRGAQGNGVGGGRVSEDEWQEGRRALSRVEESWSNRESGRAGPGEGFERRWDPPVVLLCGKWTKDKPASVGGQWGSGYSSLASDCLLLDEAALHVILLSSALHSFIAWDKIFIGLKNKFYMESMGFLNFRSATSRLHFTACSVTSWKANDDSFVRFPMWFEMKWRSTIEMESMPCSWTQPSTGFSRRVETPS